MYCNGVKGIATRGDVTVKGACGSWQGAGTLCLETFFSCWNNNLVYVICMFEISCIYLVWQNYYDVAKSFVLVVSEAMGTQFFWHIPKNQGCGAVTFLVGSGSGSGSGEAFRLRLRLRLRVKLFGGSGSGSGSGQNVPAPAAPAPAPAPMIKSLYERFYDFIVKSLRLRFLPGIRFSKMTNVKTWLLTDLAVSLIATLNECFF